MVAVLRTTYEKQLNAKHKLYARPYCIYMQARPSWVIAPGWTRLRRAGPGCARVNQVVLGGTGLRRVVLGGTGLRRVVLGGTGLRQSNRLAPD